MKIFVYMIIVISCVFSSLPVFSMDKVTFELDEALEKAFQNNPEIKAFRFYIKELEVLINQASRKQNPELDIEAENVFGSGLFSGVDEGEFSINLSQIQETGRKRKHRTSIAEIELTQARIQLEILQKDLIRDVSELFFESLYLQNMLKWHEEIKLIIIEMQNSAKRRVKAGAASSVEMAKISMELNALTIEQLETQKQYFSSLENLKRKMGIISRISIIGQFDENQIENELLQDDFKVDDHPLMNKWNSEVEKQELIILLEKADARSNINWSGGFKYENGSQDMALSAGVSIPLMFHNKNKGNIKAAEFKLNEIHELREGSRLELLSKFYETIQNMNVLMDQLSTYKDSLIPSTKDAFEMVKTGYRNGRFSYLDLLEGSRTMAKVKNNYVNTLFEYRLALITLDWLNVK